MSVLTEFRRPVIWALGALVLGGATLSRAADDTPSFATAGYARGARTQEMMDKVDTNGDGMVSRQEWLAFHEKVFAMLDTGHKGSVNASEFVHSNSDKLASFATGGFASGLQTTEMMQKIDTNGDGLVSHDEYMANQQKIFDFMDTSKDHKGMLSPAEVLAGGPRR
jgi:hypothetical protein